MNRVKRTIALSCFMVAILVGATVTMGCTGMVPSGNVSTSVHPDPETGVVYWISAINDKNIPRLYELSPDSIRKNISEHDFILANQGNLFLKPGFKFLNYKVANKTVEGDNATIEAILDASLNMQSGNSTQVTPLLFNFNLTYEDNEWKIWDVPF